MNVLRIFPSTNPSRLVPSLLWFGQVRVSKGVCADPRGDLRHSSGSPNNASSMCDCGEEALIVQVGCGHRTFHRDTPKWNSNHRVRVLQLRKTPLRCLLLSGVHPRCRLLTLQERNRDEAVHDHNPPCPSTFTPQPPLESYSRPGPFPPRLAWPHQATTPRGSCARR